ncbi:MAG TPA: penicillin-binding protein 2 [Kiritimatiellia bacterium]|nr:penicillin-binding protein 2 [Kiritimatiellia bacterium]
MARGSPWDDEFLRLRVVLVGMLALFVFLGGWLWHIQVHRGPSFEQDQMKQSMRRVRLPGVRGRLLDREGRIVADNRPSYTISIYMEELRQPGPWDRTIERVETLLRELEVILGEPSILTRQDIRNHIRRRLPLPLVAWRDISEPVMARFAEQGGRIPGVDIQAESTRVYPFHEMAGHAIGYVGRAEIAQDEEEPFHFYLPEVAGRSGLEKSLDAYLRGEAGGRLLRVDVTGYRRYDFKQREPRPGQDVMLTLDMHAQALAEKALGADPGSVVVLDPRNGDVLALVSRPGFDPNDFVPAISSARWSALNENPLTPMLNRSISGGYAPGSTFKVITMLAGLESGKASPADTHHCPGYFQLGRATFRCWFHPGHGSLAMRRAIEQSCNVYCFHLGLAMGMPRLHEMSVRMGLGARTGIELENELAGLVPDDAWKRRTQNDVWRDGDTCNVSIGQGALVVTPLQMAQVTALIANGGRFYRPRLVRGVREFGDGAFAMQPPELIREMQWPAANLDVVRQGMRDVVHGERGTARRVAIPGITIAGKTGTAEFGRKDERKRHAWMIAFAPFEAPRYAVALLVDEGISGGETAAPRMRELLLGLLKPESAGGRG